jgi:exopolyphosphatase/guanosine-5'-triphosphate,3'-diphosphate pyrophosphatase
LNRFAAIDVGSNAMRCLVVEATGTGSPHVLESVREPVRLGSGVFLSGSIGEPTASRAVEAFRLFRRLIDTWEVGHVRAIATSAMREAADSEELVGRIRDETGIDVRIIDGAEEARLVGRAVSSRIDLRRGRVALVDVGGGSVEVVVLNDGEIVRTESFTMGAVRLLEALSTTARNGDSSFFALLQGYVDAIRSRVRTAAGKEPMDLYAATGGSVVTLADLAGEAAEGPPALQPGVRTIPLDRLREWTIDLASLSYRERIERHGLREDRADVILPAAVVYLKLGEVFGVDRLFVPDVGLKDGLVLDMIDGLQERNATEGRRREVRSAALGLGQRYALDEQHANKVTELALSLFDQLEDLHGVGDEGRTILEAASLLHDVGLYISASRHHKHSYYLLSQSDVVGLDARQREIVANVARYHRKRHPTRKHPAFAALDANDRELVRRLAAILRVADVLDREHRQHVRGVKAMRKGRRMLLHVEADGDLLLERWASTRKFRLFEEVFGVSLALVRT